MSLNHILHGKEAQQNKINFDLQSFLLIYNFYHNPIILKLNGFPAILKCQQVH